jgi:hypothetical protein
VLWRCYEIQERTGGRWTSCLRGREERNHGLQAAGGYKNRIVEYRIDSRAYKRSIFRAFLAVHLRLSSCSDEILSSSRDRSMYIWGVVIWLYFPKQERDEANYEALANMIELDGCVFHLSFASFPIASTIIFGVPVKQEGEVMKRQSR